MGQLICASCRIDWGRWGSPAICPNCQKSSFAVVAKGVEVLISPIPNFRIDGSRLPYFGAYTMPVGITHQVIE